MVDWPIVKSDGAVNLVMVQLPVQVELRATMAAAESRVARSIITVACWRICS